MCLDELCLWGQLKVELSGFARLRVGIEDRCLDGSIDNESDFINTNRKAIGGVMAGGIGLNNPGEITSVCGFNPDIGAFDGLPGGILHNPFKSRRPGPSTESYKEYKPTKLILYDLSNISASNGFLADKSRTFKRVPYPSSRDQRQIHLTRWRQRALPLPRCRLRNPSRRNRSR